MWAVLVQHTHLSGRVSEHHQVFSQDAGLYRGPVWLLNFFTQANGHPMLAHQLPHGGLRFYTAEQVIFFRRQHLFNTPRAKNSGELCHQHPEYTLSSK